jgi:DNA-binding NarL/FixJ family response regulator
MPEKITVLLVDDHTLVRRRFRRILEDESSILVVGEASSEETWVRRAMDAGARGYILKSATCLDLASAIKRIVAGERVIDSKASEAWPVNLTSASGRLTRRELEILRWIVDGQSNKEIAARLNVSVNTVATHRANIMNTLGFHKTAQLVAHAIRNGLVHVP